MEWLMENKGQIWLIFTSIVTVASMIAKLTPTKADDQFIGKILKILSLNK